MENQTTMFACFTVSWLKKRILLSGEENYGEMGGGGGGGKKATEGLPDVAQNSAARENKSIFKKDI